MISICARLESYDTKSYLYWKRAGKEKIRVGNLVFL